MNPLEAYLAFILPQLAYLVFLIHRINRNMNDLKSSYTRTLEPYEYIQQIKRDKEDNK